MKLNIVFVHIALKVSFNNRHEGLNRLTVFSSVVFKENVEDCHSPGMVGGGGGIGVVRKRTFSNISVITEDIYLKLGVVVHYYQKGNPYQ